MPPQRKETKPNQSKPKRSKHTRLATHPRHTNYATKAQAILRLLFNSLHQAHLHTVYNAHLRTDTARKTGSSQQATNDEPQPIFLEMGRKGEENKQITHITPETRKRQNHPAAKATRTIPRPNRSCFHTTFGGLERELAVCFNDTNNTWGGSK